MDSRAFVKNVLENCREKQTYWTLAGRTPVHLCTMLGQRNTATGTRCQIILACPRKKGAGKYVKKKMTSNFWIVFHLPVSNPSSSRGERC